MSSTTPLADFAAALQGPDLFARLRAGLIGDGAEIEGPFGPRPLVYADYTASGRALVEIERFVLERVLPFYANSHTEASHCGRFTTRLRQEARATIARCVGAGPEHAVIFAGAGATAGINRLVDLLGVRRAVATGPGATVFLGPYEHHSNILPWRESGARIVVLPEGEGGGPDRAALERALADTAGDQVRVAAFSAASNVTGIVSDIASITALLNAADVRAVWDYAGGGPYLPIAMDPGADVRIDALVVSPHKFVGGPGASGVLVIRRDAVRAERPTQPGGGTVRFVSAFGHDYAADVVAREEAGTPNVVGDIRAALAFLVKEAMGERAIAERNADLVARAFAVWGGTGAIELLGPRAGPMRLPIFSFRVRAPDGGLVHHQLFTRMLSDVHGIQARGGCACAGPYGLALLGIGKDGAEALRAAILAGREVDKPGWVRLNLSPLMDTDKVDFILDGVLSLARAAPALAARYACDTKTARFTPIAA